MSLEPWKTVEGSQETIHENAWFSLRREKFILPNGKEGTYNIIDSPGSVVVIPVLSSGKIRLVRQYRYLFKTVEIEFVAGGLSHGGVIDEPVVAAERELAEEAGLKGRLIDIGQFAPFKGFSSEITRVYVAHDCEEFSLPMDDTEEFELVDLDPSEIDELISSGRLTDGMTLAAWCLYRLKTV